ncbi:MAG: ParB/RepB/Spo0J family partition protein [Oscillospiraceae bacterium]|nr:ParB/RepB/Spo0J family partition protein [Oscillospiraceae bacterium]MDD6983139.1 ParB/RepB/Spo0J family partition protein [Oscillospiraceae bacterium]MDY4623183.1 ParB/RepB/Spo0J family partition protein [Oscillospiraceae bacterium]
MAAKKGGLGRGLDALFADNSIEEIASTSAVKLKIMDIEPNRDQPRKIFDEDALAELADSIAKHGVIQPLLVRPMPDGSYQLVAGERRWRASRMAGLSEVPVVIKELSDDEAMALALIENLQREDLNAIEEAQGIKALMDTLSLTQDEAAERVGKSRPAVANALRLLKLPDSVIALVSDGKLSPGHARALLGFKDEQDIIETADLIIEKGLTVRDVEKLVKKRNKEPRAEKPAARRASYYDEVELALTDFLGRKVKVGTKPGKESGVLEIDFFNKDDLTRLADALKSLGD